jgi:chitin disaccharide deacetylase
MAGIVISSKMPTKFCIVNADDFGMSSAINRGILDAHLNGIVTSTSLMVNMPYTHEALLARDLPELSVGLHVNFTGESHDPVAAVSSPHDWRAELDRQLDQFHTLMGTSPTHLDSHQNVHLHPSLLPLFDEAAKEYGLPLRGRSSARYFSSFYGQWDGETHLEQVSVESLTRMLRFEFGDGVTELSCHPGHADSELASFYSVEREAELRTLCDPAIRRELATLDIQLITFRDLRLISSGAPNSGEKPPCH